MRIVLVGPGALGCLLAAVLARESSGAEVTILDHRRDRAAQLTSQGLVYSCGDQTAHCTVSAIADPCQVREVDVLVICVKSYDVSTCLEFCRPVLKPDTLVVFLQNGIGHLALEEQTGAATAVYGTTSEGATLLGTGAVRHAGSGSTHLGFLNPAGPRAARRLDQFAASLAAAGLQAAVRDNMLNRLWAKLFVNVGINALTAIHDCSNGTLLTLPGVKLRMMSAVSEARQVAETCGISVQEDPWLTTEQVCRNTADNISSMLQDIRRRRRTEIAAINGAVVDWGRRLGVTTPENFRLTEAVRALERTFQSSREGTPR